MKHLNINFIGAGTDGFNWGEMASGSMKSTVGIGQLIGGAIGNKKANKMVPPETDPSQVNMLDVFRRLRKGYTTGSEASSYKDTINQGLASQRNAIIAASGGNAGTAAAALAGGQGTAGDAYNQMVATLEKNRLAALNLESDQTDKIANRKLDIQMMKYHQKKTQAQANIKAGTQNWMAGAEEFAGGITGSGNGGFSTNKVSGGGEEADDTSSSNSQDTAMATPDSDKLAKFEKGEGTFKKVYRPISAAGKALLSVFFAPAAAAWGVGDVIGDSVRESQKKKLQMKAAKEQQTIEEQQNYA